MQTIGILTSLIVPTNQTDSQADTYRRDATEGAPK